MKRLILCAMILMLSLASIAEAGSFAAEPRTDRWDFSIQTRYSWSQTIEGENGTKMELEDDLGWGFGFSKYVSEKVNVGLAFAWHSNYYTATGIHEDAIQTASYTNVLSTSAIALTGEYAFGAKRFKPYVSGNLGWMRANTNITAELDGGCWYYPYVGEVCAGYPASTYGNDSFTYGLGLGVRIDLSPTAFLEIGYEHSWVDLDAYDGNDIMRIDLGWLL